uniref:UDP-N-acetylmuramoyl-L-alanyl-D-glutamate--2,6-diaminopimelate ligase n=1 Tax=candidate division WOR-3 bacterium TaxID=2052148 RepID=A0A7C4U729_UNCW3
MKTKEILNNLKFIEVVGEIPEKINEVKIDSKNVKNGDCFVAIKGEKLDGHSFIDEAYKNGASLFIVEREIDRKPYIKVSDTRLALARISSNFYNNPSSQMKIFGITGTNGKTTTAFLLKSIYKDATLLTTIGYFIKDEFLKGLNTTPDSLTINKILYDSLQKGVKTAIMEVSSHSVVQKRVEFIDFKFGIFTNLTRDHLDYHKTFEAYRDAKASFFSKLDENSFAILNYDDPSTEYIIQKTKSKIITYGLNGGNIQGEIINSSINGLNMIIRGMGIEVKINSPLIGRHNASNILAAFSSAIMNGKDIERIKEGIESFRGVKGRLEKIDLGQPFNIFIDYAHTPDAMVNVISSVKELSKGSVTVIFGAGGNRDKGKRKLMGMVAEHLADRIILTSDNPRDEEPVEIIKMIAEGIENKKYEVIEDRKEAIRFGIKTSKPDDTILILGKGHEDYQEIKGKRIPFSDYDVVVEILKEEKYET